VTMGCLMQVTFVENLAFSSAKSCSAQSFTLQVTLGFSVFFFKQRGRQHAT